ncbi:hypothetical protein LSTR_LSTR002203 [Laodelphax striatellus]|uniref:Uncharacterized protein n=1 Tax=Laodelphax striatellus TaxID=195883 RepID=A0A482XRG2_LAOST|nr:hypothetical protein LSTR_LSTR002203 [Laodelphax striatellus]
MLLIVELEEHHLQKCSLPPGLQSVKVSIELSACKLRGTITKLDNSFSLDNVNGVRATVTTLTAPEKVENWIATVYKEKDRGGNGERERKRKGDREREREIEKEKGRERERERVRARALYYSEYRCMTSKYFDWKKRVGERMSVFFFRLHNLRRQEEESKKRRRRKGGLGCGGGGGGALGGGGGGGGGSTTTVSDCHMPLGAHSNLTLASSRLFEKAPLTPSDSLDEIALKIPSPSLMPVSSSPSTALVACFAAFQANGFESEFVE